MHDSSKKTRTQKLQTTPQHNNERTKISDFEITPDKKLTTSFDRPKQASQPPLINVDTSEDDEMLSLKQLPAPDLIT